LTEPTAATQPWQRLPLFMPPFPPFVWLSYPMYYNGTLRVTGRFSR